MSKHRTFNADRFLDKFHEREPLLRAYVATWDGRLDGLDISAFDIAAFKEYLVNGGGDGKDELLEGLYRAHDLSTERGHEDLIAACRDFGYDPDPTGKLPVECLSLQTLTEKEDAFDLAYARNTLWSAERFTLFRGKSAMAIADPVEAAARFQQKLAEVFRGDKKSDRVLVRQYQEGARMNLVVYHEKRTKAELVFSGTKTRPKVSPAVLRPAQQDFISYDRETGQVEIETRFQNEEVALRKSFAECCLGDADFFEDAEAASRINLAVIAEDGFKIEVGEGHTAALIELHFSLSQTHAPSFVVRSKNVVETLETNSLRRRLAAGSIRRAVFKITFPDDARGKRVELSGSNSVKFKRATHADEVFTYLRDWKVLR